MLWFISAKDEWKIQTSTIELKSTHSMEGKEAAMKIMKRTVTWEVREGSFLYNVLSVQGLQNLGASEPLETTLHIVIIPFEWLRP